MPHIESSSEGCENARNESGKPADISDEEIPIKKELDKIVQDFKEKEALPEIVTELIVRKKLNIMLLDLFDYDKGFSISFCEYGGDAEIWHGNYSYGVSLIEYIRDGQIPYEVFDNLYKYDIKIFYGGYIACKIRIHFGQEDSMQSHYVLLKHTIQTIDAQCCMNCKADSNLDFEVERARLIKDYSPELCLDPDPVVAEIVISNELNQYPFITPYLKHIIQNEKARREKGVLEKSKSSVSNSEWASRNLKAEKQEDWSFRLKHPEPEEIELTSTGSDLQCKDSLPTYLKERPICFPDKESFTGFHVEIENFVYEYNGCTKKGNSESITDKFCISVIDDKEYYYGAYRLDERMKDYVPYYWWPIGGREDLDLHINAITHEEMKLTCGGMKITHYRMFDEKAVFNDGKTNIVRQKLEVPVSRVVLHISAPSDDEDEDEDDDDENEEMDED